MRYHSRIATRRSPAGQSLVELALILPILFLVIFYGIAILMFGYDDAQLSNMAQRAAIDMGQAGRETGKIDGRIQDEAVLNHLDASNLTVCVTFVDGTGANVPPANLCHMASTTTAPSTAAPPPGSTVEVTMQYKFFVPMFGGPRALDIKTTAEGAVISYYPGTPS